MSPESETGLTKKCCFAFVEAYQFEQRTDQKFFLIYIKLVLDLGLITHVRVAFYFEAWSRGCFES